MSSGPQERPTGTDSKTPQDVIVGLFDILGFARRVETAKSLESLVSEYQAFLDLKLQAGNVPTLSLAGRSDTQSPSAVFSDTVLFWATAKAREVERFLHTCAVLIADALDHGWPVRGGIAAGECYLNRRERVFVGLPIVEAYRLEQSQDWIGASFHSSALNHPTVGSLLRRHSSVVQYSIPVKAPVVAIPTHALAWHHFGYDSEASLKRLLSSADPAASKFYTNALTFLSAHPL